MMSAENFSKKIVIVLSFISIISLYPLTINAVQPHNDYTYEYVEEGYSGELHIKAEGDNKYSVKISTLNQSNSATCDTEEICVRKNDKIICIIKSDAYPDQSISISGFGNNTINVESNTELGYMCGMNGYFDGKYKLIDSGSSSLKVSASIGQQSGPVVFGLYLGMPYDNAVQKLTNEGYEIKYLKVRDDIRKYSSNPMRYTYHILKNGTQIGRFDTKGEKGIIFEFALSPSVFGVKDYDQLNFAKQFLDHYKIPYSQEMFSITKGKDLLLTNRQAGYELSFSDSAFGFFVIRSIQKNSDIQFK